MERSVRWWDSFFKTKRLQLMKGSSAYLSVLLSTESLGDAGSGGGDRTNSSRLQKSKKGHQLHCQHNTYKWFQCYLDSRECCCLKSNGSLGQEHWRWKWEKRTENWEVKKNFCKLLLLVYIRYYKFCVHCNVAGFNGWLSDCYFSRLYRVTWTSWISQRSLGSVKKVIIHRSFEDFVDWTTKNR